MLFLFVQCLLVFQGMSTVVADISFHVFEEQPIHTMIGIVPYSGKLNESHRFLFIEGRDHLFSIDKDSGAIYTASRIDREDLCVTKTSCVFQLKVRIDSITTTIVTVNIHVDDINDNAPLFDKKVVSLEIRENNEINKVYPIVEAWDFDSGVNSQIHYSLLHNESGTFSLIQSDWKLVGLKVNRVLDYEKQTFYQLVVEACDQGTPPQKSRKTLNITVLDTNDNYPIFEKYIYNETILENIPISSTILTLRATDKDSGVNGQVKYRLSLKTSPRIRDIFEVQEDSGKVILKAGLGDKLHYFFNVIAYDQGPNSLSATVPVNIKVVDVNNHSPVITFETKNTNVSESKSPPFHIALVDVDDKDENDNGKVNCSIKGNNQFFSLTTIYGNIHEIILSHSLDFESRNIHNITVQCEDNGNPRLKSENTIVVNVIDANDNPPVFQSEIKHVNIRENNQVPMFLTKMLATDRDSGINSEIYYYLESNNTDAFIINNRTGLIETNKIFDRESIPEVYITVLAVDSGTVPLTSTAKVQLSILDQNDNTPIFQKQTYEFHILEAEAVGSTVGCVIATDTDIDENGAVSYTIESNNNASQIFLVRDGVLKNQIVLNHVIQERYDFVVTATDHGNIQLSSSVNVTIFVEDANDNWPQIIFPIKENNSIFLSYENTANDQTISQVIAYDEDEEDNARLSYYFVNNELTKDLFRINETSGDIMLIKNHKVNKLRNKYSLRIHVTDHGKPPKANYTTLYVYVEEGTGLAKPSILIPILATCVMTFIFLIVVISAYLMSRANKQKRHYFAKRYEDASLRRRHYSDSKRNEFNNNSGKVAAFNRVISELQECGISPDTDARPPSEVNTATKEVYENTAPEVPSFQYSNLLCQDEANGEAADDIICEAEVKEEQKLPSTMDAASIKGSRAALLDD
ncbi:protocadherin-11 X-linked-like [Argonauta hians]